MKIASWRGLQSAVSQEEANEVFASGAAPFEKETSREAQAVLPWRLPTGYGKLCLS